MKIPTDTFEWLGCALIAGVIVLAVTSIYGIWWEDWRIAGTVLVIEGLLVVFTKLEHEVRGP